MRSLWRRSLEIVRRSALDREAEEIAIPLALRIEEKCRAGIDPVEARRQALVELGRIEPAREQVAEGRTGFQLEQLGRDVAYAARVLRRTPTVSLLSIVMLGLAIGVSALLFALVNHIVLQPLPYPTANRLVRIYDRNPEIGVEQGGAASGTSTTGGGAATASTRLPPATRWAGR
jgi:hypothetical protein